MGGTQGRLGQNPLCDLRKKGQDALPASSADHRHCRR